LTISIFEARRGLLQRTETIGTTSSLFFDHHKLHCRTSRFLFIVISRHSFLYFSIPCLPLPITLFSSFFDFTTAQQHNCLLATSDFISHQLDTDPFVIEFRAKSWTGDGGEQKGWVG